MLAHYLADVQGGIDDEITWDERALTEHGFLCETDLAPVGIPSVQGLLPSLHLNLGDGYHLTHDGYGAMIRSGLKNLGDRITAAGTRE